MTGTKIRRQWLCRGRVKVSGTKQVASMRSVNQRLRAIVLPRWRDRWASLDPPSDRVLDLIGQRVEFYRREADRMLRLAAAAQNDQAKRQFQALARQYETLAEHTAQRFRRDV